MKVADLFPSKYLGSADIKAPMVVTIQQVTQQEVNDDGGKKLKPVLIFSGNVKPLILNRINADSIASIYGDDIETWPGKSVEFWVDPNVMMAGRRVGGLRVRAPSSGYRNTLVQSTNGHPDQWDIWDGQTLIKGKTTDEVREFLANTSVPIPQLKLKPAGTGREMYKPADQWGIVVAVGAGDDDQIPF